MYVVVSLVRCFVSSIVSSFVMSLVRQFSLYCGMYYFVCVFFLLYWMGVRYFVISISRFVRDLCLYVCSCFVNSFVMYVFRLFLRSAVISLFRSLYRSLFISLVLSFVHSLCGYSFVGCVRSFLIHVYLSLRMSFVRYVVIQLVRVSFFLYVLVVCFVISLVCSYFLQFDMSGLRQVFLSFCRSVRMQSVRDVISYFSLVISCSLFIYVGISLCSYSRFRSFLFMYVVRSLVRQLFRSFGFSLCLSLLRYFFLYFRHSLCLQCVSLVTSVCRSFAMYVFLPFCMYVIYVCVYVQCSFVSSLVRYFFLS